LYVNRPPPCSLATPARWQPLLVGNPWAPSRLRARECVCVSATPCRVTPSNALSGNTAAGRSCLPFSPHSVTPTCVRGALGALAPWSIGDGRCCHCLPIRGALGAPAPWSIGDGRCCHCLPIRGALGALAPWSIGDGRCCHCLPIRGALGALAPWSIGDGRCCHCLPIRGALGAPAPWSIGDGL
jgi:hypothetical protein